MYKFTTYSGTAAILKIVTEHVNFFVVVFLRVKVFAWNANIFINSNIIVDILEAGAKKFFKRRERTE